MNTLPEKSLSLLKNKLLVIAGLGREGLSTYRFLKQYCSENEIVLYDEKTLSELSQEWHTILTTDPKTTLANTQETYRPRDPQTQRPTDPIIFKSPGISPHSDFYQKLLATFPNAKITSNTNMFFELVKDSVTLIGVTGTKGKSTTTSAIYHLLSASSAQKNDIKKSNDPETHKPRDQETQRPIFLAGNIGVPPLDLITKLTDTIPNLPRDQETKRPIIVLELSSHQLLQLESSPHIAVIQEIVPEHLDYYQNFQEYVQAKSLITKFQTSNDIVIFNSHYAISSELAKSSKAQKIDIAIAENLDSSNEMQEKNVTIENNWLVYKNEKIVELSSLQIKGSHNILNILPAIVIGKLFGIPNSDLNAALQSFKPLKHRLELVATINDVEYYNDSLATTPEACIAALQAFPNKGLILIAGGYDRHLDFKELAHEILKQKVKTLILFKPTGSFIAEEIEKLGDLQTEKLGINTSLQASKPAPEEAGFPSIQFVETMQEAVQLAHAQATEGDVVLMSPASASFGRFKDYADRGEQFSQEVKML